MKRIHEIFTKVVGFLKPGANASERHILARGLEGAAVPLSIGLVASGIAGLSGYSFDAYILPLALSTLPAIPGFCLAGQAAQENILDEQAPDPKSP